MGRACVPANEVLGVEDDWQIEYASDGMVRSLFQA